ncbi:condensation domain-containing protein, partial [Actinophytocola sp.]|uniref:condensation domain-containing protein n=1 Tax=Actinophytocola sp. TaxID=1872138 RepID=UPI00389A0428
THPDLEGVVGPFVNTIVLRLAVPPVTTLRELVRQAREVVLGAQEHADLPFERLVDVLKPRRDPAYNPVFQVNFGVGNFPREDLTLPGILTEPVSGSDVGTAKFDLSLYVTESEPNWYLSVEYNSDLFDEATIHTVTGHLDDLLAAGGDAPDAPIERTGLDLPTGTRPLATRQASGPGRFVPPRDQWERDVAQTWSEVLGVDPVGATDDFFALGGNSMAGMLVIDLLGRRCGHRVPLATLMRHPTVETLATALRGTGTGQKARTVVTLAVSPPSVHDRPPLFFMHAVVGELVLYFHLARELRDLRPVYGVQSDGVFRGGADPGPRTLRQLAARYAQEIIACHPGGPYHLCGFSAAGRLAVAVADQLATLGRPVGAVVLLDTAPFGDVDPDPDLATVLSRWLPFAPSHAELSELDRPGQLAATLAAGTRAGDVPPNFTLDQFERLAGGLEHNARAFAGYRDPSYPGPVTLFRKRGDTGRDITAEWAALPIGELRVEVTDADTHMGLVSGPAVPAVARQIEMCLTAAEPHPFTPTSFPEHA